MRNVRPFSDSASPGGFSAAYLQSYLISFAYGFAIVLVVNLGIFPISAERQFRIFLVQSLERISTLAHLVSKVCYLHHLFVRRLTCHLPRPTLSKSTTKSALCGIRFTRVSEPTLPTSSRVLPTSRSSSTTRVGVCKIIQKSRKRFVVVSPVAVHD